MPIFKEKSLQSSPHGIMVCHHDDSRSYKLRAKSYVLLTALGSNVIPTATVVLAESEGLIAPTKT